MMKKIANNEIKPGIPKIVVINMEHILIGKYILVLFKKTFIP